MIFGRQRFGEAIDRQLDLFERENSELLGRIEATRSVYRAAGRDEAEERYSEYLDLVEIAVAELEEMRDAFAAVLEDGAAAEYEQAFDRTFRERLPSLRAAG